MNTKKVHLIYRLLSFHKKPLKFGITETKTRTTDTDFCLERFVKHLEKEFLVSALQRSQNELIVGHPQDTRD